MAVTTYTPAEMAEALRQLSIATETDTDDATLTSGGQMLDGITAYSKGDKYVGTIQSKPATTYNTSSSDRVINAGQYLSGDQTIKAVKVNNLIPDNIRSGVTVQVGDDASPGRIASVVGTHSGQDTSDATLSSGEQMLKDVTAYSNGEKYIGTIETKSESDLSASGAIVSVPAGYYASATSKSVSTTTHPDPTASINTSTGVVTASHTQGTGYVTGGTTTKTLSLTTQSAKTVTPSTSEQTAVAAGVYTTGAVKVAAMSAGSATTPATTISVTPSISVNSSGRITASASGSKSVTPTVTTGYVSSGTAGTVTVSGSNTYDLSAKAAATYTPGTTDQTIASGQYLTGAQTIKGDSKLVAGNIKSGTSIFGVTGTYSGEGGTDTSSDTVTANVMLSGYTAHDSTGTQITGTIPTKTHPKPTATINSSTGVVTASHTQETGYVTGGTTTGTLSLATKAAAEIRPGTTDQTIAAGQYLTGAQTIKGDSNLVESNLPKGMTLFSVAGTSPAQNLYNHNFRRTDGSIFAIGGTATESEGIYTITATATDMYVWETTKTTNLDYSDVRGPLIEIPSGATQLHLNVTESNYGTNFNNNYITYYNSSKKVINSNYVFVGNNVTLNVSGFSSGTKFISIRFGTSATVGRTYKVKVMLNWGNLALEWSKYPLDGAFPTKTTSDITVSNNVVNIPAGYYSTNAAKTVGTAKAAETFNTSSSDRSIAAGYYLTGAQTIKAVTTSGIEAGNIKYGSSIQVGDANSAGRIKNVSGTFTRANTVSSGQTAATAARILSGYSAWVDGAEVKGSIATYAGAVEVVS